jgi:hypothetical protein
MRNSYTSTTPAIAAKINATERPEISIRTVL